MDRARTSTRAVAISSVESSGVGGQQAAAAVPPLSPSVASLLSAAAPLSPLPPAVACGAGGDGGIGEERRTTVVPVTCEAGGSDEPHDGVALLANAWLEQ
uniref:Uncharacterized protein n=1 Tax=Oryza meridionalis TaxID=40149 RepID=A0A0E0D2V3_9ORYZ